MSDGLPIIGLYIKKIFTGYTKNEKNTVVGESVGMSWSTMLLKIKSLVKQSQRIGKKGWEKKILTIFSSVLKYRSPARLYIESITVYLFLSRRSPSKT